MNNFFSTENNKGVIAYGCVPYATGTVTFYLNWAPGLRALGWKVYSVAVGKEAAQRIDPKFSDKYSIIIEPQETDFAKQVEAFITWTREYKVDFVIPNYENNIITAIPYLDKNIKYVTICHGVIRSAFLVSSLYSDLLSFSVAMNKQQMTALSQRWGVPIQKLRIIPNAIDINKFNISSKQEGDKTINIIFLGNVNHAIKGVLWLPQMMKKLNDWGISFFLHVVGSGPDLEQLKTQMFKSGLGPSVSFYGSCPPDEIPTFLSKAAIFLMPSRFEGFPMSLLEAMAAGCVPIVTHLKGITDVIVEDGVDGFLCPIGKTKAFAERIALLARDRKRLALMAEAARRKVVAEFGADRMADNYDALFSEALSQPHITVPPRPLEHLTYPKELMPTWRAMVPQPVKTFVRTWANRLFGRVI